MKLLQCPCSNKVTRLRAVWGVLWTGIPHLVTMIHPKRHL